MEQIYRKNTLIPQLAYVNHTISGGDFTGLKQIPLWDEVSLHNGRITRKNPWGMNPKKILKECYQDLNKFIWLAESFHQEAFYPIPPENMLSTEIKEVSSETWDECVDKWKNANWIKKDPYPSCYHIACKTRNGYTIKRAKTKFRLYTQSNRDMKFLRAYDIYIRINAFTPTRINPSIFIDNDYNSKQGCLVKILEENRPAHYPCFEVSIGDFNDISLPQRFCL